MKCAQCGKNEFIKYQLCGPTDDGFWRSVEIVPYICKNCGHVEFFVTKETLQEALDNEQTNFLKEEFEKNKQEQIVKLEQEIARLKQFIADENNTLKDIKSAEKELKLKEEELVEVQKSFYNGSTKKFGVSRSILGG